MVLDVVAGFSCKGGCVKEADELLLDVTSTLVTMVFVDN